MKPFRIHNPVHFDIHISEQSCSKNLHRSDIIPMVDVAVRARRNEMMLSGIYRLYVERISV